MTNLPLIGIQNHMVVFSQEDMNEIAEQEEFNGAKIIDGVFFMDYEHTEEDGEEVPFGVGMGTLMDVQYVVPLANNTYYKSTLQEVESRR